MAKILRREGTADVDQSGKILYWTGQSLTPHDTDLALSTASPSTGVQIPSQIKVDSRGRNRTISSILFRVYNLTPVLKFGDIRGPLPTYRNGSSPYGTGFEPRPSLYRYFVGWRFTQDMPADTLLYVGEYSATEYYPTTEERTASSEYHAWPAEKKGNGGGRTDVNIPDKVAVPNTSSFSPADNTVVAAYAFSPSGS